MLGSRRTWLIGLGLVNAFLVGAAAGIFYSRPTLCSDVPCERFAMRGWAIENAIQQGDKAPRYLAIGDSITEGALLPEICGRRPINAGIIGATVKTFERLGPRLADMAQPDFIILALGTNDALRSVRGFPEQLAALVGALKRWPVIVVPLPPGEDVKDAAAFNAAIAALQVPKAKPLDRVETTDGIHLTPAAYAAWKDSIVAAASGAICPR